MPYMRRRDERLLFLPLGGSGEIGMNLNLYAHKGKWLMVDCGMMFADDYTPGIELQLPDASFIEEERDNLLGMLITHGHEDHIGAIPYLWEELECPIYATPFTAELIKGKLKEAGLLEDVEIIIVEPNSYYELGPFEFSYIPLAHSIAEGHGIAIKTSVGTIFHTGDWKLDDRPLIGPDCPSPELSKLGDEGIIALIGDSTNVFNAGESGSEAAVRESLIKEVSALENRVLITTFASNVARLETIGAVAKATGRHLALMGRSMQRVLAAGRATGYLKDLPPLVDEEHIADIPRDKILIACTGCQGEPRAAIARIARDEHKHVHLSPSDNVIFSSKIIPGNELTLGALFNSLVEKKIHVVTEKDAFIHVSGHPGRAELEKMYSWTKPNAVIPVHGEARHLMRHAEFAHEMQIHNTLVPRNGDIIEISAKGVIKVDEVPSGRIALDGSELISIDGDSIAERRRASQNGFVTVSVIFDDDNALAAEPAFAILGLPRGKDPVFYDMLVDDVETALERMSDIKRGSDFDVEEVCRIAIRRCCRKMIGKNPGVATLITRRDHIDFR